LGQLFLGGTIFLFRFYFLLLFIGGGISAARAQVFEGSTRGASLGLEEPALKESRQILDLHYESYTSAARPAYAGEFYRQNVLLNGRVKEAGTWGRHWNYRAQGDLSFSSGEEWFYPKMKDFYVEHGAVKVGLVSQSWDDFEEEWRLGLFRPRFLDNKLSEGQGGLVGIFFREGGFTLGLLPVNIPEFGPHYEEQNGDLVSKNPWFGKKPTQLRYNGTVAPIRYSVRMPPLKDLVLKPGAVAGYETRRFGIYRSRWSAAYKPMPQVLLNFPADRKMILDDEGQYFSAEIAPVVAYHALFSTDQKFQINERTHFRISALREVPVIEKRPSSWVTQELGPATYLSSRLDFELDPYSAKTFYLSQLKVWGGDRPDQGRYAGSETFFEKHQFYREAYGMGFETKWFFKKPLFSSVGVIYDVAQEGGVFVTRHEVLLKKDLRLSAEVELLGLTSERNPLPDGFLSTYRANDRAALGVSYVF